MIFKQGIYFAFIILVFSTLPLGQEQPIHSAKPVGHQLARLERDLRAVHDRFPGEMSIYMKNLKTNEEIAIDADSVYETFSVIKIPIMAEVLRQAEAGDFKLSDRMTLKASDGRLPSGVLFTLDPGLQPT